MSEQDYKLKVEKIKGEFEGKLEELSVLLEHFKGRDSTSEYNTGPFDPAAS